MKRINWKLLLLVLLICLAFASAAFAMKPLIDGMEKSIEVKQAVEESTWGDEYRHGLIYGGLTVAGIGTGYGIYKAVKRPRRRLRAIRQTKARGRHETS